jgi:hypothetical protein
MSSEPESKGSLGTASIPDESTRFNNSPDSWFFPLIQAKVCTPDLNHADFGMVQKQPILGNTSTANPSPSKKRKWGLHEEEKS